MHFHEDLRIREEKLRNNFLSSFTEETRTVTLLFPQLVGPVMGRESVINICTSPELG